MKFQLTKEQAFRKKLVLQVINKEMTAKSAAIEAGLTKRAVQKAVTLSTEIFLSYTEIQVKYETTSDGPKTETELLESFRTQEWMEKILSRILHILSLQRFLTKNSR